VKITLVDESWMTLKSFWRAVEVNPLLKMILTRNFKKREEEGER